MNRLADAASPYLRQHADNPVDWYPWGEEALERARSLDRPLFISIGYAACHWCHVMAHESFEDETIAERLNGAFVPVKVDREERPDLDAVYMEAVQALTGGGGWPLSVFATPDGRPFFGGTYYPPRSTAAMPSFASVLDAIARAWSERRDELDGHAGELTASVARRLTPPAASEGGPPPARQLLAAAYDRYAALADRRHGGLGGAPKFPQPPLLELVLRAHLAGHDGAGELLETTLGAMAAGGIYDHLEGGFARYSVDAAWQVPHFEKMLYDQALLARVYLHAFQVTGDERWRQVVTETIGYVTAQLAAPGGGFCASEDADSEGEEGRFSTFTRRQLDEILGPERGARAADAYGVSEGGNFEHGRSVLHRRPGEVRRDADLDEIRRDLARARATRVRPARDDKVLTEWNAMFCATLAEAAAVLQRPDYLETAVETADVLLAKLRDSSGRWHRSLLGDTVSGLAVAADYGWVVECFTRLGEATGQSRWTSEARTVAEQMVELFSAEDGGWYTTGSDAEALVVRPRDAYDGVTPAASSVAAVALARLGAILEDDAMRERAARTVGAAAAGLDRSPLAFPHLVLAAELLAAGPVEVVVTGERPDLVGVLSRRYFPYAVTAWGELDSVPLAAARPLGVALVCRLGACLPPIAAPDDLDDALARAMVLS